MVSNLLALLAAWALPFGPDAALAKPTPPPKSAPSPAAQLIDNIIVFHQKVISPADGPRSHFYPSSSTYGREAFRRHGAAMGYFLTCDRLLRENDDLWIYPTCQIGEGHLKLDPVP
jgi:uncharacterized protein